MTVLQLMIKVREILYTRYNSHFPILDAVTVLDAMDELHYKYEDDKLYITAILTVPQTEDIKDKPGMYTESVKG